VRDLRQSALRLFPRSRRPRVDAAAREVTEKVSAWLAGQLLLAFIIGATSAVGLWALGVPFFYVLALLSAVGELIPIVGPIISAIPALAVAATVSPKTVLFVLIFFVLQQQLENHILVPKVMGDAVELHPAVMIMSLVIGGALFGIGGAILAAPTVAAGRDLYRYGFHRFGGEQPAGAFELALHGAKRPVPPDPHPPAPPATPPSEAEAALG